ncbi:MAG: DUF1491 family protein [Hyphomicrobiaceae bacterium]
MRLKSELWVKAYLRRAEIAGSPGAVVRRGDTDAGVILIKVARLDGTADLYGPAPAGLASDDGERRWTLIAERMPEGDADARLAAERRLDSDAWIVEIEDRAGRNHLEGWLSEA